MPQVNSVGCHCSLVSKPTKYTNTQNRWLKPGLHLVTWQQLTLNELSVNTTRKITSHMCSHSMIPQVCAMLSCWNLNAKSATKHLCYYFNNVDKHALILHSLYDEMKTKRTGQSIQNQRRQCCHCSISTVQCPLLGCFCDLFLFFLS